MKLLILNYSMQSDSMIFSHQPKVALAISRFFDSTLVLTSEPVNNTEYEERLAVRYSGWIRGKRFLSSIKFLQTVVPHIWINRKSLVVFSHMTNTHSFLIAPICWLLQVKHYLWYAHRSLPFSLIFAYPFLTGVLTSTVDSFPFKAHKVHYLGQQVDSQPFQSSLQDANLPPLRWYYIGRIDPSKDIEIMIQFLESIKNKYPGITFDIYGGISSDRLHTYWTKLQNDLKIQGRSNWITYHGPLPNNKVASIADAHDAFLHAFNGSLDKSLVEATLAKRFVLTSNQSFLAEFHEHHQFTGSKLEVLHEQFNTLTAMSSIEAKAELNRIYEHSLQEHSLQNFVPKLQKILRSND